MTDLMEAEASLHSVEELRLRTRLARNVHWFVLVVFGLLTLGAMPFYLQNVQSPSSPDCHPSGPGGFVCRVVSTHDPLGGAFNPQGSSFGLNRWATLYWVIAITVGFALVLVYYRRRSMSLGVQGRIWPTVLVGGGLFFLGVYGNRQGARLPVPDAWIRGTGVVVVIAIGLGVLALLERNTVLGLFTLAFFGLALLSTLYDDANLFQRVGMGGLFDGSGAELPNLLLPGLFMLLGGLVFWWYGRRNLAAI
jgi:hypothetical protein